MSFGASAPAWHRNLFLVPGNNATGSLCFLAGQQAKKDASMDAAERNRLWEKRLFRALLTEKAKLQSELATTPRHQRLGLRLEIQACETLLAVLDPAGLMVRHASRSREPDSDSEVNFPVS